MAFTWRVTGLMSSLLSLVISIPCLRASLSGPMEASFTKFFISEPEYPSVNLHIMSVSSFESLNSPSFSRRLRTIHALASDEGSGMYSRFVSRLLAASSSSWGLFVAPIRRICSLPLSNPSISIRNCVFSLLLASCSPSDLR
uniref:Secreted protein n=2 Tax=Opuntia streptacantha TaxID=393608 RepID=A0A7C9FJS0_OPUST